MTMKPIKTIIAFIRLKTGKYTRLKFRGYEYWRI